MITTSFGKPCEIDANQITGIRIGEPQFDNSDMIETTDIFRGESFVNVDLSFKAALDIIANELK